MQGKIQLQSLRSLVHHKEIHIQTPLYILQVYLKNDLVR